MKSKNALPKAVLEQFRRWGKLGGLARKKKLTQLQRSMSARKAGLESGRARRAKSGTPAK
jgi:hypothetical protein